MNSYKFIKDTFLKLTSKTYPYGTEDELVLEMTKNGVFPNLQKDEWGNYFYSIGSSKTIFTSHLDTACRDQVDVKHFVSNQQIVTTDGTTILGADDKAGVTILLWLMKNNIPGVYYFFVGEEVGCIGSNSASKFGEFSLYDRIISFDRRGTNSVITHQSSVRTCSDEFAKDLSKQLNLMSNFFFKPDDTGIYTDSAEFASIIPECTNISVGYDFEHTFREKQDLLHLNKLAQACLDVKWEELPIKRDPSITESKWQDYYEMCEPRIKDHSKYDDYSYGCASDVYDSSRSKKTRRSSKRKNGKVYNKVYYDGGGKLEQIQHKPGVFNSLREKFLTTNLTRKELEMVKEQYLDMSNPYDRIEYQKLSQLL